MQTSKKFYAVRKGRHTGVFFSWDECKKETSGYKGAIFKSFATLEEAQNFCLYEEEKEEEIINGKNNFLPQGNVIFVDGSYRKGDYSWGFVAYQNGELFHTAKGKGKDKKVASLRNVAGEIEAVLHAVKWADEVQWQEFTIIHDYSGLAEWAEGRWKTNLPFTQNYAQKMIPYRTRVRFQKVTGHTGVLGNELADRLAQEALDIID